MEHFLSPKLRLPEQAFQLRDVDQSATIASSLEWAFDSASRRHGLLGRTSLPGDYALIIAPCPAIHTFFMQMAIDVIFVTRTGIVLKTYSGLRPWRIGFAFGAFAAIECASGTIARTSVTRGHRLGLSPAEASVTRPLSG